VRGLKARQPERAGDVDQRGRGLGGKAAAPERARDPVTELDRARSSVRETARADEPWFAVGPLVTLAATLRASRRVLIARKSYQQALPLFDSEARITSDPRRKAALYLAKGRLLGPAGPEQQPFGPREHCPSPSARASSGAA
jgi:hypothetical protein